MLCSLLWGGDREILSDLSKINRNNVSGSVETEQLNIPLPVTRLLGHFYPLMSTLYMQTELSVISLKLEQ